MDEPAGRAGPVTVLLLVLVAVSWWTWGRRRQEQIRRQSSREEELDDLLASLVTAISVGLHPLDAVEEHLRLMQLPTSCGVGQVGALWRRGRPARECLSVLADHYGERGERLARMLVAHLDDGLPLEHGATRLLREADESMRRSIDIRVRQLPVRLAAPLVLCVLPAFVLSSLLPLAAMTRSTFGGSGTVSDVPVEEEP